MTVNNIFEFLNEKFPVDTACDFDNVGLLVGDGQKEVKNVLISLDCTLETVQLAKQQKNRGLHLCKYVLLNLHQWMMPEKLQKLYWQTELLY